MRSEKPRYLLLYEKLRQEIISGALPVGRKLPSKRMIALNEGVSLITVEHALELLLQEGYVVSRERSGVFAAYRAEEWFGGKEAPPVLPQEPLKEEREPERSEIPGFPVSVFAKAVRKVLSEHAENILLKTPNAGLPRLREAISAYLGRNRGLTVSPEQIFIGSGAEYLYGLIVETLGTGLLYGVEDPSYEKIRQIYESKGVRVEPLPLGKDGITSKALASSRADVLHISPFRSFPTGVTAGASKKQEYLRFAKKGRIIIEDDFESEFSLLRKPEDTVFGLSGGENVLYLNTFSRTVSPAIRTGYMVVPASLVPLFREKIGHYSCPVPALEQYVLAELLENGDFERHVNRIRREIRRNATCIKNIKRL